MGAPGEPVIAGGGNVGGTGDAGGSADPGGGGSRGWFDPPPSEAVRRWLRRCVIDRSASARRRVRAWRERAAEERRASASPSARTGSLAAWSALALAMGIAVRLYYFLGKGGFHYPDEIFQYIEPAYWKGHGFAWLPWEYDRGVRNWILPGYYGGLMHLLECLGLRGLALHSALALHNALFSALIIPAGYRLGRAVGGGDERLAVLTAFACALFPVFGYFAPHTLSEIHGLVLLTWAYALWMEQVREPDRFGRLRKAFAVGVFLGAAFVCRYTLVLFLPIVLIDYNFRARFGELAACLLGLVVVLAFLGMVDRLTWGRSFHSVVEYFKYNWIEHGASQHGVMPRDFYWSEAFVHRLGPARFLLLVPMVAGLGRHWRMVVAAAVPLLALSTIPHKEERFVLPIWPLVLTAALSGTLALADRLRHVRRLRDWRFFAPLRIAVAAVLLAAVCTSTFFGVRRLPMRWKAGVFAAQDWIGRRPDATGVLVEDRPHLNGGYVLLGRNIPQLQFSPNLLAKRLYNYVAVYDPSLVRWMARRPEFDRAAEFEGVAVFRRRDGLVP